MSQGWVVKLNNRGTDPTKTSIQRYPDNSASAPEDTSYKYDQKTQARKTDVTNASYYNW